MTKKMIVGVAVLVLIGIAAISLYKANSSATVASAPSAASQTPGGSQQAPVATANAVPLMQSTGSPFAQYKYYSKAHQIFPTLASDTKKALGAFSYKQESLGNNEYRFTLTNDAEGYKGQSVVVSGDQSVYFIEPATGDDSASEDSITTDDSLVAVDAQGNILK